MTETEFVMFVKNYLEENNYNSFKIMLISDLMKYQFTETLEDLKMMYSSKDNQDINFKMLN